MAKYQKYVNLLFIGAAVVVWIIANHYTRSTLGWFQAKGQITPALRDILGPAIPVLLALVTFITLRRNTRALAFSSDSVAELTKMTWPTPKDTQLGTVVVIIAVLLAAVFIAGVDIVFNKLVNVVINF
jgi:preprotein translocase SecE subunit